MFHDHHRSEPGRHLRHHPSRRRAVAGRVHEPRREAAHRPLPRGDGRRRDRGRFPHRVRRGLRGRQRHRPDGHRSHRRRAGPGHPRRHRSLRRGGRAGAAQAHPHLHLHLAAAHEVQAADGTGRRPPSGHRQRHPGPQPLRRRGVVARGRLAHGSRLPVSLRRDRHQVRRDHDQHPRHGGLRPAPRVRRADPNAEGPGAQHRQGRHLRPLPQRPGAGRGELPVRGPRRRPPGGMHRQRPRRAGRQRGDGRGGHGASHPPGRHALRLRRSTPG